VLAIIKLAGLFLLVPRYGYLASAALLSGFYIVGVSICAWKALVIISKKIALDKSGVGVYKIQA